MQMSITDARDLALSALEVIGYTATDADTISTHIVDAQLRGYGPTGLARILTIGERMAKSSKVIGSEEMQVTRSTAASAQLDAHGAIGYLAAHRATELAIQKAQASGAVGIVGVSNTFYAGMLSFYAEMCTRQNLVALIVASAGPWVAPEGSYTPCFGTNPMCIGFPTGSGGTKPVIWDIGTSKITHAQMKLAQLMDEELPEGMAWDCDGRPTKDATKGMDGGAMAVWGGHKGSGLAIAIQLLGALAGAPAMTQQYEGWGLMVIAMDPEMFRPLHEFTSEVDTYSDSIRASKPLPGHGPVRMPFDRSSEVRERTRKSGFVQIERSVMENLRKISDNGRSGR